MARFGSVGQQYLDNNGDPLSAGKLFFYEPSTTTDKTTYSDSAETTANTQPYVLDAAGRQGDIFFSGQAKVVLKASDDTEIDTTDPVGSSASSTSALGLWSSSVTYAADDLVRGSDDNYYISISGSNTGNNPVSSPTSWMQVRFVADYNSTYSYDAGDIAVDSNVMYISLTASNSGNTPASSPTNWRSLGGGLVTNATTQTTAFNAVAGNRYMTDTTSAAYTMTLPAGVVGARVGFVDFTGQWSTNNLTIAPAGGEKIMGEAADETMVCALNYYSGVLEYTSARGWILL